MLRDYLSSKEKEVVDIMMVLYDEQEVMKSYVESEIYDEKIESAKRMLEDGTLSLDKIAQFSDLPIETVKKLADSL